MTRRPLILGLGALGLAATLGKAAENASTEIGAQPPAKPGTGKPGDFDFLAGEWRIANRQRQAGGSWKEFAGAATVRSVLGGIASIEELRIPVGSPLGMGLRLLDLERHVWCDYWISAKSGALAVPGQEGSFVDGVGTFISRDEEDGKPVLWRGVWDRITPVSCRWFQGVSKDGGKTWDDSWFMDWTRVPDAT